MPESEADQAAVQAAIQAAIQAIEVYVRKCGRDYSQWCAGIADDPVEHLLGYHGVAEEGDGCGWITYQCATPDAAHGARDHFLAKSMKAASGDMNPAATSVYVFKITGTTRL